MHISSLVNALAGSMDNGDNAGVVNEANVSMDDASSLNE